LAQGMAEPISACREGSYVTRIRTMPEKQALSQNSVFLANRRWPVEVSVSVCVKLASAMQPIKLFPGKWLGKGNHR
jgi:hypothetical protein